MPGGGLFPSSEFLHRSLTLRILLASLFCSLFFPSLRPYNPFVKSLPCAQKAVFGCTDHLSNIKQANILSLSFFSLRNPKSSRPQSNALFCPACSCFSLFHFGALKVPGSGVRLAGPNPLLFFFLWKVIPLPPFLTGGTSPAPSQLPSRNRVYAVSCQSS